MYHPVCCVGTVHKPVKRVILVATPHMVWAIWVDRRHLETFVLGKPGFGGWR